MHRRKFIFVGTSLFLLLALASTLFLTTTFQHSAQAAAVDEWPTYLGSPQHTDYQSTETTLNASNVGRLALKWSHVSGTIGSQPVVSNGVVYWGSYNGLEDAFTTSGQVLWQTQLGTTKGPCLSAGTADTPVIGNIGSTPVLYVGAGGNINADGHDNLVALNARTGAVIWKTDIGSTPSPNILQWGSPTLYNGSLYLGITSLQDCPVIPGQVLKINATTGQIQATFNVVPPGCNGSGVWSTPTIINGNLYLTTGNPGSCSTTEQYGFAILEFNPANLALKGYWHLNINPAQDLDFGASVTPFSVNGVNYVGAINKNGSFYAFHENNLSAGPVWTQSFAVSTDCPNCIPGGNISSAAFDGTHLYVAAGQTTLNGVSCPGTVNELNPATGAFLWRKCLNAPVLGSLVEFPGVLGVAYGNTINLLNPSNGNVLYTYKGTAPGSLFWSGLVVAEGMIFAGNMDGRMFAFGL